MADRTHHFDLKLLTASKDIGLRRLRSYAAALGGGAQIFHAYDDLRRHLEANVTHRGQSVVVLDSTLPISAAETTALTALSRVFKLQQPQGQLDLGMPLSGDACWQLESFMRCSLTALLESPVVRMSMANLVKTDGAFRLEHLLRWGHACQIWKATHTRTAAATGSAAKDDEAANASALADASWRFIRSLSLAGEARRLTEMASHFLQTRLTRLSLIPRTVNFASDGLTTTVIATCDTGPALTLSNLAEDLRLHDFPIGIVNRLGGDKIEIAALHHAAWGANAERIVMLFRKEFEAAASEPASPLKLEKAG